MTSPSTDDEKARRVPRKGVWMFPGVPAGMLVDAVVAAEDLGLDEVWIADEGAGRDPLSVLAVAADRTSRIRLAVGITSPLLRHPGAIAATVATLDELSGGRAVLGLGIGGQLALEPFGLENSERPVGVMKDAIMTARSVFAVERSEHYEPPAHAFGPRSVPIWVGTQGAQMSRLAARHADGILLSGCTPHKQLEIVERVRAIGDIEIALHQSASNSGPAKTAIPASSRYRPNGSDVAAPAPASDESFSVLSWEGAGERLVEQAARHRPDSVGISLVDMNHDRHADAVALVEQAAKALTAMSRELLDG